MSALSAVHDGSVPESSWRRWTETWYISYGILGIAAAGLAPLLIPLFIAKHGTVADIGIAVGAFNLGGLTAPVWGIIADHRGLHRFLLISGLLLTAVGLLTFPLFASFTVLILLAFLQGVGAASAATVANLLIVERHPHAEWDERIGWLQTFYGGGQVVGLLLAGVVGESMLKAGFVVAGGLTLAACLPAIKIGAIRRERSYSRPIVRKPSHHAGMSVPSPQSVYHRATGRSVRRAVQIAGSPLGIFLAGWLISFGGVAAFFSLYPVLMKNFYGANPGMSSAGFAIAATLSLFLYAPAGRWSSRIGSKRIVEVGLVLRLLSFVLLASLSMLEVTGRAWLALTGFLFVVAAWSLLSVASTELVAQLSGEDEGEGLGLLSASTAVAGVLGAVGGGWIAQHWGYGAVSLLGIAGSGIGIVFLESVIGLTNRHREESQP